jgi:16S rRNA (cytosine967-C5)-methyltransferase
VSSATEKIASTPSRVTPARDAAVTALMAVEGGETSIQEAVEAASRGLSLSAEDRGLLYELVNGVLRYRLYLDWALQQVAHETPYAKQPVLKQLLRLGAYQLLRLDRVPAYAAIDQSVELAKTRVSPSSAPLTNALLRTLAKRRHELTVPDLLERPIDHIAITHAHPQWLVKRWVKRYGAQRTIALCRANNDPAPLTVRVNRLKIGVTDYLRLLEQAGIAATPCLYAPAGLRIDHGGPVTALPGYAEGLFYVQDEASQLVPLLLAPRPGERVLDACAAPGGKTTEMAELMRNSGEIVALDRDPERLARVGENAARLGVTIVRPLAADAARRLDQTVAGAPYDRILVDAPCSGLGVLRRHPEGKWSKDERSVRSTARTAGAILSNVAPLLKPGGVLVYSTCSTEPDENQEVVEAFLARHRGYRLEHPGPLLPEVARGLVTAQGYYATVLKGQGLDGFFAARLVRVR